MLKDDVALVTGASRGIGRSIALALGKAGATVVGTATRESGAEQISAALKEAGITGCGMALDVTIPEQVDQVLAEVARRYAPITVLVNNAAVTRDNLLMRMKDEEWQAILDTNLTSVFRMSRAVLRGMMKARRGRIISISSVVGLTGNPGQANYAAAKAGMLGFSKSLAREIGSRNITVNVVAPGFIDTDMTRELPQDIKDAMLKQIALGRLGSADDVAAGVVFLASPAAQYITGETLNINGGLYMP